MSRARFVGLSLFLQQSHLSQDILLSFWLHAVVVIDFSVNAIELFEIMDVSK